jgi:hypothetical protein
MDAHPRSFYCPITKMLMNDLAATSQHLDTLPCLLPGAFKTYSTVQYSIYYLY